MNPIPVIRFFFSLFIVGTVGGFIIPLVLEVTGLIPASHPMLTLMKMLFRVGIPMVLGIGYIIGLIIAAFKRTEQGAYYR